MNSFFPILNWAGLLLLKEKLSHCTPYQEAERTAVHSGRRSKPPTRRL